jgi:anti-anti-sigma regulatory factor
MPITGQATRKTPVVVTRIAESIWTLRPIAALESRTVDVLRDTFLEAVDSGAQTVLVDLRETDTVSTEGVATLVAMADLMLGRNGSLWIAGPSEAAGPTLRLIGERGPRALVGMSPALDAALGQAPDKARDDSRPSDRG